MNCPHEIADILLQILARGVVHARANGWSEKLELATLEADHVHNLPDLVRQYDPEKLVYYWDCERPSYVGQFQRLTGTESVMYAELWAALEAHIPEVRASLPATSICGTGMKQIVRDMAAQFKERNDKIERD